MFFKSLRNSQSRVSKLKTKRPGETSNPGCLYIKNMRTLNGFIAVIVLILVLKWAVPQEAVDLASQILIKILTLIRDLLTQINVPQ